MNIVIVTQEDPLYIPVCLDRVLQRFDQVSAVVVLPSIPKGFTRHTYLGRLFDIFGTRGFVVYGVLLVSYRLLDAVSRAITLGRYYSVRSAARKRSIPVCKLSSINDPTSISLIRSLQPDVVVSIASPQKFGRELLGVARYTVNAHASLLPEYRGMMPSYWVLARGEDKTGVTVHHVDEGIDTGPIVLQKTIEISPLETLHSLQRKVAETGGAALVQALEAIEVGTASATAPKGRGTYYSFPTKAAAQEFRSRGRRVI